MPSVGTHVILFCCVLSGRIVCDELITPPEVWVVVFDLES
jgi:hypothetical protein